MSSLRDGATLAGFMFAVIAIAVIAATAGISRCTKLDDVADQCDINGKFEANRLPDEQRKFYDCKPHVSEPGK